MTLSFTQVASAAIGLSYSSSPSKRIVNVKDIETALDAKSSFDFLRVAAVVKALGYVPMKDGSGRYFIDSEDAKNFLARATSKGRPKHKPGRAITVWKGAPQ
jgi:hypothetical protein